MNTPETRQLMQTEIHPPDWPLPVHTWLRGINFSFQPGETNSLVETFLTGLRNAFLQHGHLSSHPPCSDTELIVTTARYGTPLNWREALMFTARRRFRLDQQPTVFTVIHITPGELDDVLNTLADALSTESPVSADFNFPGLTDIAYKTLFEQGKRGGPIMALARLLQSQAKSIRIILVVGDAKIEYAYIFDLVGAHPEVHAVTRDFFYTDIMLRLLTAVCTKDITNHLVVGPLMSREKWDSLRAPLEMQSAAVELGKRNFFTDMVMISNLVHVPSIGLSIADQYSEGCFATWEPGINGLIATVTGSARPVEKAAITEKDLAVIVGVRDAGDGAIVRHVEGKTNDAPSSESVEMMAMDLQLPRIDLEEGWGISGKVPVIRSKLHGHRGVLAYDPEKVEFVRLDEAYYHYPVSCSTDAQAKAIVKAFSRSKALRNPSDPRCAVFTVLPGHGLMMVEKWVQGKSAFQLLYELMDEGAIQISSEIPQGQVSYTVEDDGRMKIRS